MLNEITEAIEELQEKDPETFGLVAMYGSVTGDKVPQLWNYIVYNRSVTKRPVENARKDFSERYEVHIIHEDYVPENAVYELIERLEMITGLKQSQDDIQYTYTVKQGSNVVVEMATVTFVRPVKRYKVINRE